MNNVLPIIESYGRAWLVAVASTYTVNPDASLKDILIASLIAIASPLLRGLNPDDKTFGIGKKD